MLIKVIIQAIEIFELVKISSLAFDIRYTNYLTVIDPQLIKGVKVNEEENNGNSPYYSNSRASTREC
jgi:hypothetical protein